MTHRPTRLQDRHAEHLNAAAKGRELAVRGDVVAPVVAPVVARGRRRLWSAMVVVTLAALAGGAMSVIPRPEREVTSELRRPGVPHEPPETMRMVERSYGVPFRTWIELTGPAEAAIRTSAHVEARPTAVALNAALGALLGAFLLGFVRRRPES